MVEIVMQLSHWFAVKTTYVRLLNFLIVLDTESLRRPIVQIIISIICLFVCLLTYLLVCFFFLLLFVTSFFLSFFLNIKGYHKRCTV